MSKRFEIVWISPEAKKLAKELAARDGCKLYEWFDKTIYKQRKEKRGGDDYRFF